MHPLTFTAADGELLHAWRHGESGPKIVFLHGWTASHLEWSPFIHDLAAHFRLFRWDARAHGGHPPSTSTVATAARMASDLERMIEAFDLAGACFVGHSMGALTLWQYLRDFGSARIGALCLIDQSPRLLTDDDWKLGIYGDFDAARSARFIADLREDFAESVLRLAAHGLNDAAREGYAANGRGWQRMRDALRALAPEPLIVCWQDLVNLDLRGVLPGIDRPCLLIYGGRSNFYPVETAYWVQRQTPGGRALDPRGGQPLAAPDGPEALRRRTRGVRGLGRQRHAWAGEQTCQRVAADWVQPGIVTCRTQRAAEPTRRPGRRDRRPCGSQPTFISGGGTPSGRGATGRSARRWSLKGVRPSAAALAYRRAVGGGCRGQ